MGENIQIYKFVGHKKGLLLSGCVKGKILSVPLVPDPRGPSTLATAKACLANLPLLLVEPLFQGGKKEKQGSSYAIHPLITREFGAQLGTEFLVTCPVA